MDIRIYKLVKMGLVKNYTGSRMANLYCMKVQQPTVKTEGLRR